MAWPADTHTGIAAHFSPFLTEDFSAHQASRTSESNSFSNPDSTGPFHCHKEGPSPHLPRHTHSPQPAGTYIILLQHAQDLFCFFICLPLLFFDVDDMRRPHVWHIHCLIPVPCEKSSSSPGVRKKPAARKIKVGTGESHCPCPSLRQSELKFIDPFLPEAFVPFFFIISAGPCSKMEWDWITSGRPRPRPWPSRCRSLSLSRFSFLMVTSSLGLEKRMD